VKRDAPQLLLLGLHLFVLAAGGVFHAFVRPSLLEAYRATGREVPATIALVGVALPVALALSIILGAAGALTAKRGARLRWWGAGVAVAGFAFAATVLLSFAPLLAP